MSRTRMIVIGLVAIVLLGGAGVLFSMRLKVDRVPANASTASRHVMGEMSAPIHLTLYTDYECPYCRDFHIRFYQSIKKKYGDDIVVIYKNFPREEHKGAYLKALVAECVARLDGEAAYWKYVTRLFEVDQPIATNETPEAVYAAADAIGLDSKPLRVCSERADVHSLVDADIAEGKRLGVTATPGVYVEGAGKSTLIQGNRGNGTRVAIDYIESILHGSTSTPQ